ncbi:MAG TPA: hypothetical protein VHT72_08565, partial [Puia sp.]|nr:hypothetical protein [Puia sp.]
HKPEVLLLDEPTTGVDAVSRKEFWDMLKRLKAQHISILVSTPYMDEASLCDRIALIQNGYIMSVDKPEQITNGFPVALHAVKSNNIYQLLKDFRSDPAVESCYPFGEYLHLTLKDSYAGEPFIHELAKKYQAGEFEAKRIQATIEDSFIRLMKENESVQNIGDHNGRQGDHL